MTGAVFCDFTIRYYEDVTDMILEKHALPEWRQVERSGKTERLVAGVHGAEIALLRASKKKSMP